MKLVSGNSNKPLSESIAKYLGVKLVDATIKKFPDKEIFVEIQENVRGEDVFVIQSTSFPANDHVMELLITIDALKRGSAKRIAAIMPYYGYARQDRKSGPRTPISAKLLANLISTAGADRALMVDLHAGQIQGFFDIPTDNLFAAPVFINDIKKKFSGKDFVIISPDVGGVVRARAIAKRVDCDLAIIDKRREKASVSEVMNIIGEIKNKHCILIDDMNIKDIPIATLRNMLGVVLQDTFIFSGNVADNLKLNSNLDNLELENICYELGLDNLLKKLPEGLNTFLRERGGNLSSGERQLLSVARVAIRNPVVLIMDEATAFMDPSTEATLQKDLERILSKRTALVIAHRLATIESSDKILVLKGGSLVEEGTHSELRLKRGLYFQLSELQQKGFVNF